MSSLVAVSRPKGLPAGPDSVLTWAKAVRVNIDYETVVQIPDYNLSLLVVVL